MKRLLPVLFLIILLTALAGAPSAQAQRLSQATVGSAFPVAVDDTAFTFVNTPVDIFMLDNDFDTNAGAIRSVNTIITPPKNGTVTIERNNTPTNPEDDFLRYTPVMNYVGKDSLVYELTNQFGGRDQATVRITVNRAPVAVRDTFRVRPNVRDTLDVLANDTDADGDSLNIEKIVTAPRHGTAAIVNTAASKAARNGSAQGISYLPTANFIGFDSLRYSVFDQKNGLDSAWVHLTVNTPPVARNDSAGTLPGTAVTIGVLANDTDADRSPLSVSAISKGPANGTASIRNDSLLYTPRPGFSGLDSLRYVAADTLGGTDDAQVLVVVNTPPVARDDSVSTDVEMAVDIDVLANDSDPNGDPITITAIVAPPAHGTAVITGGGQGVRYTPAAGFFGVDTFDYRIADDLGGTDRATVTVGVLSLASVQFIHNALGAGPVDLYVDDTRVADDFDFRTATPYLPFSAGAADVDVTDAAAPNNNSPLFSATIDLDPGKAYVAIAHGIVGQNFSVLVKEDARPTANNPLKVEFFIVHGVPDAPASGIDLRLLDPLNSNLPSETLADNIIFGGVGPYLARDPGIYNVEASDFLNAEIYDVYQFNVGAVEGGTFVMLASGQLEGDPAFRLLGFDAGGNLIDAPVVTATEGPLELPTEFALRGNYPNPFNPATTIAFDLPEAAEVSVEVIDVMGRHVLTVPAQQMAAGAGRSVELDGARLASGTYLYRLVARTATETMIRTGRMTLIK